jgi:hypothetical protein
MSMAPPDVWGDEHQVCIYMALMTRSDQLKVRNRGKIQMNGEKETRCIVVTGMLQPPAKWADPAAVTQLQVDMRTWCSEFGQVDACVVLPVRTSWWAHQIFVAFSSHDDTSKSRKHFEKLKVEDVRIITEVVGIADNSLYSLYIRAM